jgi:glucose-1-phosphate adenylyltransferase
MSVLTLILAGGPGRAMSVLTAERPKPALPIGGKYRLVDFTLSNVANSGFDTVAVLAQFNPAPLLRHIGAGEPWDFSCSTTNGVEMWLPGFAEGGQARYRGSADALNQNRKLIAASGCDRVLILSADQIYRQDYRALLRFHDERGADLTIASRRVPQEEAHRFGLMDVDEAGRVTAFDEKPAQPRSTLASLGFYVFNTEVLLREVGDTIRDIGRDLICNMVARDRVVAYPFEGTWADIGTVQAYWEANLALLDDPDSINLSDPDWPIVTRAESRLPARLGPQSVVHDALLSDGCEIHGTVIHSVLSPGVIVEEGAVVRDAVILRETVIESGAVVDRCVVDESVRIAGGVWVGFGDEAHPNKREPDRLTTGITLIGKRATIPDDATIGRNCRIDPHTTPADYDSRQVPSGGTVSRRAAI